MKGIKREFSIARTPQQNRVAERKNRTLIEAARTMLADSLLPTTFWAEAVKTACYVQNRVLVTKPHNKTPYELLLGRPPSISFMRPFGCLVTILITLDPLGNQTNGDAGIETNVNVGQAGQEKASDNEYILLPPILSNYPLSSSTQSTNDKDADEVPNKGDYHVSQRNGQEKEGRASNKEYDQHVHDFRTKFDSLLVQQKEGYANSTNGDSTASPSVSTVGPSINTDSESINTGSTNINTASPIPNDSSMQSLENTSIFDDAYDDREVVAEADLNNLETTMNVRPIPTTRIHKDHPIDQITGDINLATQTRRMTKIFEQHAMKVIQTLEDLSWIEAMQEELLQFQLQKVWTLVNLPNGKRAIGTKWVFRNKKDERGVVIRNKARLVAQGYTQEEGINYDEVFALVARIEAIRLFLAYASFMGFIVYQMDVKSAFLYGTIEEEVYVCQPPGFEDPQFPDKVYKVEKALYGLHQAPRAWYETLSTYLIENGFRRGTIDKTLFIKKDKGDILLVHVYVDDIIFGSTKKSLCDEFEGLMHKRFQMSSIGELTFFLGLQVQQKEDGIFISQDKYVAEILKKKSTIGEYVVATNCCGQVLWIQDQMLDYGFNFMNTKIYIDNESTICIVKNIILIKVIKIHTDHNVADLLTKAFDVSRFNFLVASSELEEKSKEFGKEKEVKNTRVQEIKEGEIRLHTIGCFTLWEDLSDIGSPRADYHEYQMKLLDDRYPYVEAVFRPPRSPDYPSRDYVPGPEEPEQAPPSPDYVLGPEHADDEIVAEDQPYAEDASPTAQSPNYVPESDPEADPVEDDDEDPEEDPVDGGDDGDDEEGLSEDEEDDDMDIEADDEEEEEEHLAPADSVFVALPATDQAPSAEETELFETDESAATPPPYPAYRMTARISIPAPVPTPVWSDAEVTRILAISTPPS
ncbi:putative ribonuclease H-like domain-containing protein [Tanacetum coccineum]